MAHSLSKMHSRVIQAGRLRRKQGGFFVPFGGADALYTIQKSLRFRSGASAYLSRTPTSAGNQHTWTWSGWVKRGRLGVVQTLFSAYEFNVTDCYLGFSSTDQFRVVISNWTTTYIVDSAATFKDPTAWYHVVVAYDTTLATAADRIRVWVNDVQQSLTGTHPAQNFDSNGINTKRPHNIGRQPSPSGYLDGYLAESNFVDGYSLTPTSFGYLDSATSSWRPRKYSGVYGVNGFYLPFNDGTNLASLGQDRSGNGNNWTCNNISLTSGATYDWMADTPTNNYAVLNPLDNNGTLSEANLTFSHSASTYVSTRGSMGMSSGKWVWEVYVKSGGAIQALGICNSASRPTGAAAPNAWMYDYDGVKYSNGVGPTAYGASYTTGDVLRFEFNADTRTLECFKNNVSQGVLVSGLPADTYFPWVALYGTNSVSFNFGQRPFAHAPSAGFKALCTANLPAGTIVTSGTFTGNVAADGPSVFLNGVPLVVTINGNAVVFGTHADKTAYGFKLRTSSTSYNASGSNTFSVTSTGAKLKYANAQINP